MEFKVVFLKNFSSGDVVTVNEVKKEYSDYDKIINNLKEKIHEKIV